MLQVACGAARKARLSVRPRSQEELSMDARGWLRSAIDAIKDLSAPRRALKANDRAGVCASVTNVRFLFAWQGKNMLTRTKDTLEHRKTAMRLSFGTDHRKRTTTIANDPVGASRMRGYNS